MTPGGHQDRGARRPGSTDISLSRAARVANKAINERLDGPLLRAVHAHPRPRGDGRLRTTRRWASTPRRRMRRRPADGGRRHGRRHVRRSRPERPSSPCERRPQRLGDRDGADDRAEHAPTWPSQLSLFRIVVGVALLLTGIGFGDPRLGRAPPAQARRRPPRRQRAACRRRSRRSSKASRLEAGKGGARQRSAPRRLYSPAKPGLRASSAFGPGTRASTQSPTVSAIAIAMRQAARCCGWANGEIQKPSGSTHSTETLRRTSASGTRRSVK